MKMTRTILAIAMALLALTAAAAYGQTNYISFTNVTVTAYTGYRYEGNTSDSVATLGASVDLWTFNAGKKLGALDIGLCADVALSADTRTVNDASAGLELMKNFETSQYYGAISGVRGFDAKQWGCAADVGARYNLHRTDNYCVWAGANMRFLWLGTDKVSYCPGVQAGIAF